MMFKIINEKQGSLDADFQNNENQIDRQETELRSDKIRIFTK